MMASSFFKMNENSADIDEGDENRVILQTHDIKPPFLDGSVQFTKNT